MSQIVKGNDDSVTNIEMANEVHFMIVDPVSGKLHHATAEEVATFMGAGSGGPFAALTDQPTVAWDYSTGKKKTLLLGGNRTLTVSGTVDGDFGIIKVKQGAGSNSLTLPGNSPDGFTLSTGPDEEDMLGFVNIGGTLFWSFNNYGTPGTPLENLSTPGSFSAAAASDTQIDLSWTDVANESSYLIQVSDNGTSGWTTLNAPAAGATSYSHTGLTAATTKFYRIKAVGDGITYSDSSYATDNATTTTPATIANTAWHSRIDPAIGRTERIVGADVFLSKVEDQVALSGVQMDFVQAVEASQPKYIASGINSLPSIEINTSTLLVTGTFTNMVEPFTRIAVIQYKTLPAAVRYTLSKTGGGGGGDFANDTDNKFFMFAGTILKATSHTPAADTRYLIWLEFVGDGATDKMYINGTLQVTGNAGATPLLARMNLGLASSGAHAWIGDHMTYAGILSAAARNSITTELKTKYGIA